MNKTSCKIESMLIIAALLISGSAFAGHGHGQGSSKIAPDVRQYRQLTQNVRDSAEFMFSSPGTTTTIKYFFTLGTAVYEEPIIADSHLGLDNSYFYRSFWDRILFEEGSYLEINGDKLPLTCIFVNGQDNRFAKKNPSPLFPEFLMRIYLVANDYSCQGPKRPGWPEVGGNEENWDTYIYYEIKDPTIMLPTEAKIRYRWNEFHIVLMDKGGK